MKVEKYNEKQLHIMDKALELFSDRGFSETSVRNIAEHADINIAMISYYFGSKQQLLEAIFTNYLQKKNKNISEILIDPSFTAFEKVDKVIDFFIDNFYENRKFNKLMVKETINMGSENESQICGLIKSDRLQSRKIIEKVIKHGQRAGIFRKELDIAMMAAILFGSINQIVSNSTYYTTLYKVSPPTKEEYNKKVMSKFRVEIKKMFKAYLSNENN